MQRKNTEKGQAIILIVFAMIGLIGLTALTVDGGMAFSDRRHAQNAADNAAYAAALAYGRGQNLTSAGQTVASANSYDNNGTTNIVDINYVSTPNGGCPVSVSGVDITVTITSHINTFFAPIVGVSELTNVVSATSRACGTYTAPLFDGNAIVALAPSGTAFSNGGNSEWVIEGSGIYSNSSTSTCNGSNGAVYIKVKSGAPTVTLDPGSTVTAVGCVNGYSGASTGAQAYTWSDYESQLPRQPACNGTAYESGGIWYPESGKDGSNVEWDGDMVFSSGLYCVTDAPYTYHGEITGSGVTFYVPDVDFSIKFNGAGNAFAAQAPTSGEYSGVLLYVKPKVVSGVLINSQDIDLRGNGLADFTGTILAPSADITMHGNANTNGIQSQIIGYTVQGNGTANMHVVYNQDDNYQAPQPVTITLLQ